jgi:glutamyl-tRNA reductase
MTLVVMGLSHRTAPVEQREKAALGDGSARAVLRSLAAEAAIAEAVGRYITARRGSAGGR